MIISFQWIIFRVRKKYDKCLFFFMKGIMFYKKKLYFNKWSFISTSLLFYWNFNLIIIFDTNKYYEIKITRKKFIFLYNKLIIEIQFNFQTIILWFVHTSVKNYKYLYSLENDY